MIQKLISRLLGRRKEKPGAAPGALIDGRYRLEAEIGRGGMGIVYRAYDQTAQREVAIKFMDLDRANALTRSQFAREAEIATRLRHPHIVTVYETGTVDTGDQAPLAFLVMELIRGASLEQLHGLTYDRILDIGKQICEALEYAHSQGIVYRDLKPGNVLIERDGFRSFVRLTDFGLARPLEALDLEQESSRAGTVFYLAPELIAGQTPDVRSDLYALGATLYEMITGRVPFSNFDEQAILSQHLEEPVAPPGDSRADVPPELEALVLRLLAKNPADRPASAEEVRQTLEHIKVPRRSLAASSHLPKLSADLDGREGEVSRVKQLLETNRLVTLTGEDEGLALGVATRLAGHFPDGVCWVDLDAAAGPGQVRETVAARLGVQGDPERSLTMSVIEALRESALLLVLTHCGRFPAACAQLAETILGACPDVRLLATSNGPLNVAGEASIPPGSDR